MAVAARFVAQVRATRNLGRRFDIAKQSLRMFGFSPFELASVRSSERVRMILLNSYLRRESHMAQQLYHRARETRVSAIMLKRAGLISKEDMEKIKELTNFSFNGYLGWPNDHERRIGEAEQLFRNAAGNAVVRLPLSGSSKTKLSRIVNGVGKEFSARELLRSIEARLSKDQQPIVYKHLAGRMSAEEEEEQAARLRLFGMIRTVTSEFGEGRAPRELKTHIGNSSRRMLLAIDPKKLEEHLLAARQQVISRRGWAGKQAH